MPAFVFTFQLGAAVAFILVAQASSLLKVDKLSKEKVWTFLPYTVSFVLSIYANGKTLEYSNVETVIIFRACSPIVVSVLDYFLLGRELPNLRSTLAMAVVLTGTVGYVLADHDFQLRGVLAYSWVTIYLAAIVFEMTYGKILLSKIGFEAPVWGSVLYANITGLGPMAVLMATNGELSKFETVEITDWGWFMLISSSAVGIGIGWSGWNCRDKVSATSFTLIGVTCKLLSVLLNVVMWDKHASAMGIVWLILCLLAGTAYQQAPIRKSSAATIESIQVPSKIGAVDAGEVELEAPSPQDEVDKLLGTSTSVKS